MRTHKRLRLHPESLSGHSLSIALDMYMQEKLGIGAVAIVDVRFSCPTTKPCNRSHLSLRQQAQSKTAGKYQQTMENKQNYQFQPPLRFLSFGNKRINQSALGAPW